MLITVALIVQNRMSSILLVHSLLSGFVMIPSLAIVYMMSICGKNRLSHLVAKHTVYIC